MNGVRALSEAQWPDGWSVRRLSYVAPRVKRSGNPDAEPLSVYLDDGVVPRSSREDNHNQLGEDLSRYLSVRPGDIVFNKLRSWQGGMGVSEHSGIVSPAYYVCRPNADFSSRFLHYLLRSRVYLSEIKRISKWMPPSQFDTPWDELKKLPVVSPPLEEQRRIADFLDAETSRIEALISSSTRLKEVLIERRAGKIYELVSGGNFNSVPTSIPWLESIPSGWKNVKINFHARMGSGHTPSRSVVEWWDNPTVPWITTGEVTQVRDDRVEVIDQTREAISHVGIANSSATIHPAGTVVLSRTASAGFSAVMGSDMATSQDFVTWTCGPSLDPYYLLWCLRAMRPYLLGQLAMGSTHLTIYVPDLQGLRIPLPPLEEQEKIVREIRESNRETDYLCDELDQQIDLLAERKQALITAAVTGQLDVTTAGRATSDLRA